MFTTNLKFQAGHLYVSINEHDWLLDTGAPMTFGNVNTLHIGNTRFDVPNNYMGLNASQLSEFVGHTTVGIIGTDILNQFNIIIDTKNEIATFTNDTIPLEGNALEIDEYMGIPIIIAKINGENRKMFFDTGAQISYFQNKSINNFPAIGEFTDFYPGFGQFQTNLYMVDAVIGTEEYKLRCGQLPKLLSMTLLKTGTEGIVGNEIFKNHVVGYFPSIKKIVLASDKR